MRATTFMVFAACLLLAGQVARADDEYWQDHTRFDSDGPDAFPGNQFSVDMFGTWSDRGRFGEPIKQGGGGAGVDYFVTRYLGIGADTYLDEWRWPYRVDGSLILRLPLQHRGFGFAPYAFGGGGREFKYAPQYTYHGGAGVEFKFNRYTGIFVDGRRVFPERTEEYTLFRGGISLSF